MEEYAAWCVCFKKPKWMIATLAIIHMKIVEKW
jgi:hypothetical protein